MVNLYLPPTTSKLKTIKTLIDPFAPQYFPVPDDEEQSQARHALSLFELNSMVRAMLQHTLADCYWVAVEISEMRVASNGHCYLEFVQKDTASGSLVAKARANIWRQNYVMLSTTFERATGQRLTAGIKVMVCVTVSFHELYGFSLNVIDIDPTYTLGDLAQRRREIIRQLEEDGVMHLNKELPLPRVIRRVAIISSPTAAGYGDFCNQLDQSSYDFHYQLFSAVMQGDHVEQSIISALNDIALDLDAWDVVVIIRGGGATTDLNGFDSYLLAANVAQFPLPVLTGIGHERDDTIVDLVAHTRLKTPTAVAAFLIERRGNELVQLQQLQERLVKAVQARLQAERAQVTALSQRCTYAAQGQLTEAKEQFMHLSHRYQLASSRYLAAQQAQLMRYASRIEVCVQANLQRERQRQLLYPSRIRLAIDRILQQAHQQQVLLQRSIHLAGPERILAMGYSITRINGKAVRDASDLKPGDKIETTLQHGIVHSVVE